MTGGVMHTLQWRPGTASGSSAFPNRFYVSDSLTALLTYLAVNSKGQVYKGPEIKR